MALHGGKVPSHGPGSHAGGNPFLGAANPAIEQQISPPVRALAEDPVPADVAYQLVHDELLLDGSARLNLATFVTTWMEPQARALMAECVDKNMIDKDEYPQTAELERRCVAMLADLWHAPDPRRRDRLLDHRLERGVHARRDGAQAPLGGSAAVPTATARKPNLVMGANVQVCWEKFCRYWDVEPRMVPMEGDRLPPRRRPSAVAALRREHHRRRRDPRLDLRRQLRAGRRDRRRAGRARGRRRAGRPGARRRRVRRDDRAVPRPGPGVGLPAAAGGVDQHLGPQVRPGLPGRRLGAVARHRRTCPRSWSSTSTTWAATCRPSR